MLHMNQVVLPKRINTRRAHKGAVLDRAFRLAYVVVDFDMALGIDLENVQPEFGFDIRGHTNLVP
jgi:hypothetical protein